MRQDRRDRRTPGIRDLDDGTVAIGARLDVVADCPVAPDPNLDARDTDPFGGPAAGDRRRRASRGRAGSCRARPVWPPRARSVESLTPPCCAATVVACFASAAFGPGAAGGGFAGSIACVVASIAPASLVAASESNAIGSHVATNSTPAGMAPPTHVRSTEARSPGCGVPLTIGAANTIFRPAMESRWIDVAIRLTLTPQECDDDQNCCMLRSVGWPPHQRPPGVRYRSLMNLAVSSMFAANVAYALAKRTGSRS